MAYMWRQINDVFSLISSIVGIFRNMNIFVHLSWLFFMTDPIVEIYI